jgi:TrmH family RNA methyltransferase
MEHIASRKNPLVQLARRVAEGDPQERGRMLLDGLHLVQEARAAGIAVQTAAFAARVLAAGDGEALRVATSLANVGCRVVQVSDAVMDALSPVSTPSGVVALATRPRHELSELLPKPPASALEQVRSGSQLPLPEGLPAQRREPHGRSQTPLLCIVVDVQDPGNLGAIVRVAEAGGATGVVVCGASADPFGWKALRGAMGSAFRLPVVREPQTSDVLQRLRQAGVRVLATAPAAAAAAGSFYDKALTGPCAILLGGEGPGLSPELIAAADGVITIPMQPPVESLNVAVSAAVIIYEARRQRLKEHEHRLAVR